MNAKDLRIGNLLQYTDFQKVKEHLRGTTFNVTADDILFLSTYSVDYVEPIQLTPEWLEKFGFEKIGSRYEKESISLYKFKDVFDLQLIRDNELFDLGIGYVYVHQLQNLYFAITGEELTV